MACLFTLHDLSDWPGKVLLLLSDNDRSAYPQALAHLFSGSGHVSSLLRQGKCLSVVEAFLTASDSGQGDRLAGV